MKFPALQQEYASVYLEDTDKALPEKINNNTRYAYFKTIAKGGKCLIQACKDLHLSRVICYKSLLPEFADDPIEQQRFLREARVSAMLQHPNTIPTYELGRDNQGHYYFTMKLVHGYTLREILDYRERYDLNQLVEVIIQVAYAIEYAHAHGVVHRDVKPENILVGPFSEVVLMDWGLAKVWKKDGSDAALTEDNKDTISDDLSITRRGKLQGTIIHMSPEQIDKDPNIDGRTDIYSLGTILYEILTGSSPSTGDTMNQMIDSVKNQEPVPPSEASKFHVPALLDKATMACLKKKPDDRLQSANELIRLLQEDWL
ncbi:serine/threonine protein kinase [Gammaproteobacteria bacterium]|jgi:eukaryotic-like serine/threonine-protein kinase|nr:serine/threonine protein kinase [Gammaproteobacteria bacterium]